MLATLSSILLVLHPGHSAAPPNPEWNCEAPEVQQEMNWCAAQEFAAADDELNTQWAITSARMKVRDERREDGALTQGDERPGDFETLLEAQRAWLAFRDAHCRGEGYYARGGSLEPLLVATCRTDLTKARTEQLKELIQP